MKKIITLLIAIMFSLALVSCAKTTYTKEFSYLPSQKTMTLKSSVKATETAMGVSRYIIKNTKVDAAIADYEKVLTKDGWKITKTKTPVVLTATKDSHVAAIVPTQIGKDVQFSVASK